MPKRWYQRLWCIKNKTSRHQRDTDKVDDTNPNTSLVQTFACGGIISFGISKTYQYHGDTDKVCETKLNIPLVRACVSGGTSGCGTL